MTEQQGIVAAADTRAFFHERFSRILSRRKVRVDEHTEHYLVELLAACSRAEQLYDVDEQGRRHEVPVALLLARALEEPPAQRLRTFRRMGDRSLMVSGFFSDSLGRRLVDVDYYIAMGGRAYESAAGLTTAAPVARSFTQVFEELAERFASLVDCLMELSEEMRATRSQDMVRTYEKWLATGSERLARRLAAAGILPAKAPKAGWLH